MATVYKGHIIADISLPAVTIDAETDLPVELDGAVDGNDDVVNHAIVLSLRVHTSYAGRTYDASGTIQLVDAVIKKLKKNINLSSTFRLMEFEVEALRSVFEETATQGALITITIHTIVLYAQE